MPLGPLNVCLRHRMPGMPGVTASGPLMISYTVHKRCWSGMPAFDRSPPAQALPVGYLLYVNYRRICFELLAALLRLLPLDC